MNGNNWKVELDRLLEIFERESTLSLRTINQCFAASGCPFDEDFRKYFLKMSARRLNTSYDMVLLERRFDNRIGMSLAASASTPTNDDDNETGNNLDMLNSVKENVQSSIGAENENLLELKVEPDVVDAPIEIVDSDDESVVEGQQIQVDNDHIEDQTESNAPPASNNGDINLENEQNGTDGNDSNNHDCIKSELKVENEIEMEDLPFVEFDPRTDNEISRAENGDISAECSGGQNQPSSSSNVQNQPKRADGKLFTCNDCTYTSNHKGHFQRHQLIHEAIKPFRCEHCDYARRQNISLKTHQRIHDRQKLLGIVQDSNNGLYKCTHCDQQFLKWHSLTKHLTKSHRNNQRLYNCERCMRQFPRETEKQRHEIRCKARRFECHLCKKYVAKQKLTMQSHMRTHSGAKPFECAVCNKCFRQEATLKRHLNFVHCQINAKI